MPAFGGIPRNTVLTRVTTATTTVVSGGTQASQGPQSISIYVKTSGGSSSPTVNGVAVPYTGFTLNLNALDGETLAPVTVVTSSGDEVLITQIY